MTHGRAGTPEYAAWINMRKRCYYPKYREFHRYGGRGIQVHAPWRERDGFLSFFEYVGPRPSPAHTLDRIDNDGDYEPGNVHWATKKEQARNRCDTKLSEIDVAFIRHWASKGFLGKDIADAFEVGRSIIYSILQGRKWA